MHPVSEELSKQGHNGNGGNRNEDSFPCNKFIRLLGTIIQTKQTMQSVKLSPEEEDIVRSIFIYSYIH